MTKMINLKVSEKAQNSFKFKLNGKDLAAALDKILGVSSFGKANAIMRRHMFISYDKNLYLFGYNSDCCIAIDLHVETEKNGSFNIEPERLRGLVKNKQELFFMYNGSELKMKKDKFMSSIKTNPVTVDQYGLVNAYFDNSAKESDALGSELLKKLRRGVDKTRLVDYTDNGQVSPVNVQYKDGNLVILTHNNYCGSYYETDISEEHEPFSMIISNEVFNLVTKVIDNDNEEAEANFYFLADRFLVSTEDIYIYLPPLQEKESENTKGHLDLLSKLADESSVCTKHALRTKEIAEVLSTITIISQDRGNMNLNIDEEGNHTFQSSSDEGSTKDTVKSVVVKDSVKKPVSNPLEVSMFAKTVHDLVNSCGEEHVVLSIHQINDSAKPNILFLRTPISDFFSAKKKSKTKNKEKKTSYERLSQFSSLTR